MARGGESLDQLLERRGAGRAGLDRLLDGIGAAVERDDRVAAARKARDHVEAHLAETDESDLHRCSIQSASEARLRARRSPSHPATADARAAHAGPSRRATGNRRAPARTPALRTRTAGREWRRRPPASPKSARTRR